MPVPASHRLRRAAPEGRIEQEGAYHGFTEAVEKAKAEYLLLASKRLNQLALGGRVEMPAWDKNGNPVRDHREDCAAVPGTPCGCPLVLVEKVLPPESRILMWQLDRCDPQPNGDPVPDLPERPTLSDEEKLAQTTASYDLLVEAIQILTSLGVPLEQLLPPDAQPTIETTSTKVEPVPADVPRDACDTSEPASPNEPPKSDPTESF